MQSIGLILYVVRPVVAATIVLVTAGCSQFERRESGTVGQIEVAMPAAPPEAIDSSKQMDDMVAVARDDESTVANRCERPSPPMSAQDVWDFLELGRSQAEVEAILGAYSHYILLMVSPSQSDDGANVCYPDGDVMWSYRDGRVFNVGANTPSVDVSGISVGSTYAQMVETLEQTSLGDRRRGYGTMIPIDRITWAGFKDGTVIPPPPAAQVLWLERRADREVVISNP